MDPKNTNSNGAAATDGDTGTMISPLEFEYLSAYFKFCTADSKPEPANIEELGTRFNLKDRKNVRQRFNRLAAKYGWFKAVVPDDESSAPASSKKASGRKKKAGPAATTASSAHDDDGLDDDNAGPSPAKKRKVYDDEA